MIAPAVLSFALTICLAPVVLLALRRWQVFDVPTERSSHVGTVPRGGGVAVAIGAVAGLVLAGTGDASSLRTLLAAVSILAVVGLIDDLRTLDVIPRLAAQLIGALLCLPWLMENLSLPWGWRLLVAIAAVIWVMGYVNAFNFMDGINGISCVSTMIAGATFLVIGQVADARLVAVCGITVAAAALGFLPYNFPTARMFLGDVGSYFLGGWIAFTVLVGLISHLPPEALFAPLLLYLADTSVTLARRIQRGERWWHSHHEHVYQQLIDRGWTHLQVTGLVAGLTAVCAGLGLVSLTSSTVGRVAADVGVVVVVGFYLQIPTLLGATRHQALGVKQPAA